MNTITQILNWISNGLLLPVIVLLLAALVGALIALGGFASGALAMLGERRRSRELLDTLCRTGQLPPDARGSFAAQAARLAGAGFHQLTCDKMISDLRAAYDRELERARFMTKVGPMLGLMGTLIPMGPALAGLASGDIASMAYNMQIAFATTVVGCFIAGVGLLVYSVKKHWYADEIANLIYLMEFREAHHEAP